jgi:hypothetical protein
MFVNGLYTKNVFPDEVLGGCIYVYKKVWKDTLEIINNIEKEISSNKQNSIFWSSAQTVQNILENNSQTKRTNFDFSLSNAANIGNNFFIDLCNKYFLTLLHCTVSYAEKHKVGELYHEGYNILKYSSGQEYGSHYDGSTESGRSISAILYLNDNYLGGEIEFTNFNLKIKPEAGSLLLFPSNYAYSHIAHPVIEGTKYAIVTWIHDRPEGYGF